MEETKTAVGLLKRLTTPPVPAATDTRPKDGNRRMSKETDMEEGKSAVGLLKPAEAARLASVSTDWLCRYARDNKVGWYRRLGHRTTRIERTGFEAWMAGRRGR